jgi:hypothetical protein
MPHRVKHRHKPRHHTHAIKPANLIKREPVPVVLEASVPTTHLPAPAEVRDAEQGSPEKPRGVTS